MADEVLALNDSCLVNAATDIPLLAVEAGLNDETEGSPKRAKLARTTKLIIALTEY
jgi:hypothetical protein